MHLSAPHSTPLGSDDVVELDPESTELSGRVLRLVAKTRQPLLVLMNAWFNRGPAPNLPRGVVMPPKPPATREQERLVKAALYALDGHLLNPHQTSLVEHLVTGWGIQLVFPLNLSAYAVDLFAPAAALAVDVEAKVPHAHAADGAVAEAAYALMAVGAWLGALRDRESVLSAAVVSLHRTEAYRIAVGELHVPLRHAETGEDGEREAKMDVETLKREAREAARASCGTLEKKVGLR
jgi:hypothetical protein